MIRYVSSKDFSGCNKKNNSKEARMNVLDHLGDFINYPRETISICHGLDEEIMKIISRFPACITG